MARKYIVCGAFGALGMAVVGTLLEAGNDVVGLDLALEPADFPAKAIGCVDLASEAQVAAAFQKAVAELGGLDGLVNVVGGFAWETVADGTLATWDRMYGVNLRTAATICKSVLAHLSTGGAIVNIGAAAATRAASGMGAYAASKAGVMALTQSLAEELRSNRIRVNAVLPTIIDTVQNRSDMPDADFADWVSPTAIARVIAFLLSPDASSITGAGIGVSLPA